MDKQPMSSTGKENGDNGSNNGLRELYSAGAAQWIHADQMRWTILYNFLVGSTILLVAWATLFATLIAHPLSVALHIVVILLCSIGLAGAILWTFLESRSNKFSKLFFDAALELEKRITRRVSPELRGTLEVAHDERRGGSPVKAHRVLIGVPLVFAAIYLVLLIVSIYAAVGCL